MVEVVIQRAVIEYCIVGGTCTCGRVQRSAFPEGVTATVQYGPGVSALAVYLTQSQLLPYQSQLLPYQGTAELFQELAGIALSPGGTLRRAVTVAATHPEAPVAAIHGALLTAPVARSCQRDRRARER